MYKALPDSRKVRKFFIPGLLITFSFPPHQDGTLLDIEGGTVYSIFNSKHYVAAYWYRHYDSQKSESAHSEVNNFFLIIYLVRS